MTSNKYYLNKSLDNILYKKDGCLFEEVWRQYGSSDYMVSDLGRVMSIERFYEHPLHGIVKVEQKILSQYITPYGYCRVQLSVYKCKIKFPVHRLVAMVFLFNEGNKPHVNHKNGIRDDNNLGNLEWCTVGENNLHAFRVLNREHPRGFLGRTGKKHHASKKVYCPTLSLTFESSREAAKIIGVCQKDISNICLNKKLHTNGLVFNYIV